ncbi:MAG TPA: serine/threonine-protein kinase, partial [Gemmatimonadales bacterium]
ARIAAQLSHPNIVPIFAVDEVGAFVFFVMAYVEGETLGHRIRAQGHLDPAEAVRVLGDVALALGHAHARGVVHRDVKPDNILLEAGTGRVLVTDFGIAHAANDRIITGPGRVVGTAEFMSPEQARGEAARPATDVYSLGVVGYYALAGRLPFTGADDLAVLASHVADAVPSLKSVAPWIPRRLAATLERCLAKDPVVRFSDGHALAYALVTHAAAWEIPPLAVRGFLAEGRHLSAPAVAYAACFTLGVGVLIGAGAQIATLLAFAAVGMVLPLPIVLTRVRRLVATGHSGDDLVAGLEAELRRRREELAFVYGVKPSVFERVLRLVVFGALVAGTAAAVVGHRWPGAPDWVWSAALGSGAVALLAGVVARARGALRDDPRLARTLRFWRGPLGRLLFRLAALRRTLPGVTDGGQPTPSFD